MLPPPLPKVSALATYTDGRSMAACMDMTDAQCSYIMSTRWHNWYFADFMYGETTVYFFCAAIAFFTALNLLHRGRQSRSNILPLLYIPGYTTTVALVRSIVYRRYRLGRTRGYSLTMGEALVVMCLIVFFSAITLGPKPYYWPDISYGYSAPIATRCGWLAIAILPFQVVLATKWNFITILTGTSHEKLQIYHRWSGWIMYILALIHTFPFIIVDVQQGMMESEWRNDWFVWSGVMALIPQTFLVTLSIGCIRDRYYETFKSMHFLMAAFFIVVLFLHCDFTLTSAYYFVGFAATYSTSILFRWAIAIKNGFQHRAEINLLDNQMISLRIPTKLKWKPGQHYFFRFLTGDIHALTSHPFTVASVPYEERGHALEVYMRVHKGLTSKLRDRVGTGSASIRVLLDGPYGGVGGDIAAYDRVLLVAGGSGGSFTLSVLRHLAQLGNTDVCQSVTVVYVCKTLEAALWFKTAFDEVVANSPSLPIHLFFHVSSLDRGSPALSLGNTVSNGDIEDLKDREKATMSAPSSILAGRPDVPSHLRALTGQSGTLGVVVCGPKELEFDVRNTIATEQLKIVSGTVACKECWLHSEAFGW